MLAGRYERADQMPAGSRGKRVAYAAERVSQPGIEAARQAARLAINSGLTPSQLGLLWVKDQPGITAPLLGSRTESQLNDALPVLEMHLDPNMAAELDKLVPPGSAVANFFNTSKWMKMKLSW
jgi:aryl-alcohol dehydrogenase-like predicted oxidoreductase